jgi:hypothetical protein
VRKWGKIPAKFENATVSCANATRLWFTAHCFFAKIGGKTGEENR